uniref:Uncharacterized protein n=1 Tax=Physcomitrium patens TaxID=3218 RepID=A0A2K1IEU0_PHYPA|nr:hypothetical protein PHYPA_029946 [Physcomitrium patens]
MVFGGVKLHWLQCVVVTVVVLLQSWWPHFSYSVLVADTPSAATQILYPLPCNCAVGAESGFPRITVSIKEGCSSLKMALLSRAFLSC